MIRQLRENFVIQVVGVVGFGGHFFGETDECGSVLVVARGRESRVSRAESGQGLKPDVKCSRAIKFGEI